MAAQVNPKVVQGLPGHPSVNNTLSVFGHFAPSMAREAGEELSAALLG